jgi:glycosyltransferase involved in cell wall biosynthesis
LILPNLAEYRSNFTKGGITYPLPPVSAAKNTSLTNLPPPPSRKTGWPWDEETNRDIYPGSIAWPKLTIVTPSYNQGAFLEQTIRSVLLQNYPNLEYIIIDGGSTDESRNIIEKYAPWLSYWQSGKDNGQSHAINMGFSLASGDYCAWINSDDYYLPNVFHLVIKSFLTHKPAFIYGYGYNFDVAQKKFELIKVPPFPDYFIKIPTLAQPSCFWAAAIHQPVWEEMHCALDYELWLRLVKGNKRLRLKQPLSVANVHGDAKTSNPKMKAKWEEDHLKMWAPDAHGTVTEWKRISFLNRLRMKILTLLGVI